MDNGITIGMQQINKIETAKTILEQLEQSFDMTVNGRKVSILSYIGVKQNTIVYDENMIMFQVPKRKKIIITLNGSDLYDIDLYSLKKFDYEKRVKDVYAEQLKDTVFSLLGID